MDLPLAVVSGAGYHRHVISAFPGDRLFIYTDGVIEAPNGKGEQFGIRRLQEVLDEYAAAPLAQLKSEVLRELHQHTGNGLTHDDVTLIAMEVR